MRQAYDGKHLDQVTNIAAKECATDKRESVQKLLKDNEATIQESIYQVAQFFFVGIIFCINRFLIITVYS
jgi:hypothetical protein